MSTSSRAILLVITALTGVSISCASPPPAPPVTSVAGGTGSVVDQPDLWEAYGRDAGGTRFSPLDQITRENVQQLEVVWVYRTGDFAVGDYVTRFEGTPLFVDETLYVSTPFGRVIALDPETGVEHWSFDPRVDVGAGWGDFANRGVATWLDGSRANADACRRRIFVAPIDARLIALDASTGRPCRDFGSDGQIDLKTDLLNPPQRGEYAVTSPPAVIGDVVAVGSAIADNHRVAAPSGVVRAFDVRTGQLRWRWDPIPREPGVPGYDTWKSPSAKTTGHANAWSVMSADPERDLLFVPTGSASPDFYGGERLGQNLFANSVVALRGSTGKIVWHFQAVHHDIWDYDVPAQPVLLTLERGGARVPAVAQATKMGHVFLLHRETGQPLWPVEERPVPRSTVPGEEAWPTQPFPTLPGPLVPSKLQESDAWGATPEAKEWCRKRISALRSEGIFTPPSFEGTILFPGNIGGANWSGLAVDPVRGLLIVPTNRLATIITLVPRAKLSGERRGRDREIGRQEGTPYAMVREWLTTPQGTPCTPPPWGALTAVDLSTGAVAWEVPLGADSRGSLNLGGAMVTGGGLVFIGATIDQRLRAFDVETGRLLWSTALPADANAMPMTYRSGGRQFVVVSAGGHALGQQLGGRLGDFVVAFALPAPGKERSAASPQTGVVGPWTGELIVEGARWPATLEVSRETSGEVAGSLRSAPGIHGELSGSRSGNTITFRVPFTYPEKRCSGTLEGMAELANTGTLLVGVLSISGGCSGEEPERGTFALRRPRS